MCIKENQIEEEEQTMLHRRSCAQDKGMRRVVNTTVPATTVPATTAP